MGAFYKKNRCQAQSELIGRKVVARDRNLILFQVAVFTLQITFPFVILLTFGKIIFHRKKTRQRGISQLIVSIST